MLRGFVSNRTRRKFSAFLAKKPDGAIGFEFEPREPRAGKTARKSTKASEPAGDGRSDRRSGLPRRSAKTAAAGGAAKPAKAAAKRPEPRPAKRAASQDGCPQDTASRRKKAAKAGAGARKASARD